MHGIADAKRAASLLSLKATQAAYEGDLNTAANSVSDMLIIVDRMYPDPTVIAQVVRIAISRMATTRFEYVLAFGNPDDEAVLRLKQRLLPLQEQVSLSHVMRGELVYFLEPIHHRSQNMLLGSFLLPPEEGTWEYRKQQALTLGYRMSGLADQDILFGIATYQFLIERLGTIEGQIDLDKTWSQILPSSQGHSFHVWSEQVFSTVSAKFLSRHLEELARVTAAEAALAVVQFRLRNDGELPDSLEILVPEILDEVPLEPRSGNPFELIVTSKGFGIGRGTPLIKVERVSAN
jgi:hypothetical protein